MGFFPDVTRGEKFQPSAVLENNLRHLVNGIDGFQEPPTRRLREGAIKIQVYNSTAAPINAGTGVNFDESKQLVGDALPAKPCSDASKPWGVVPATLKANEMGDCIVSGPARVTLSGGSGAYAQPGSGGTTFTRGESGALVLYANSSNANNGVILLGGGSGGGCGEVVVMDIESGNALEGFTGTLYNENGKIHQTLNDMAAGKYQLFAVELWGFDYSLTNRRVFAHRIHVQEIMGNDL